MAKNDELTPGISHVLETLAAGRDVDGRSWRSLEACRRRGYVDAHGKLTAAGQGALGLTVPRPVGPDSLEAWMSDHHARRLEREAAEKAARKVAV